MSTFALHHNDDEIESSTTPAFATRAIHSGNSYAEETGAVTAPLYLTSTFRQGNPGGFDYTRSGNPNFRNLEETIASLEHAQFATVFSSGVAAITAVVSSLKAGDLILAEENLYGCTFRLFEQVFKKFGVNVEYVDFSDPISLRQISLRKPELVWIESPTNPLLKVLDIERIADWTHRAGSSLVVDNTFASSFVQQPLLLGADLSLSSTTKYLSGHSDCLGGVVCSNSTIWNERLIFSQKALGLNPSPMDAWLTLRGIKTLAPRMRSHAENAHAVAAFLKDHPAVGTVRYPFLKSDPQYQLASKQMRNGSGIVTVEFDFDLAQTQRFLRALSYFSLAESLGGVESLVCHPATMTHASVPLSVRSRLGIGDSLVRFSVGIEHSGDLIDDLSRSLDSV
jgi:cystathionine gamma-synthase